MGYDKVLGSGGENVTPEVNEQGPLIQELRESLMGKIGDANATPEDMFENKSAYVGQKLVQGNVPETLRQAVDFLAMGFSKVAVDKITYPSDVSLSASYVSVGHSLGVIPQIYILFCEDIINIGSTAISGYLYRSFGSLICQENTYVTCTALFQQSSNGVITSYGIVDKTYPPTDKVITLYKEQYSGRYIKGNIEYTLITLA